MSGILTEEKFGEIFEKAIKSIIEELKAYTIDNYNLGFAMQSSLEKMAAELRDELNSDIYHSIDRLDKTERLKLVYNTEGFGIRNLFNPTRDEQILAANLSPNSVTKLSKIDPDVQLLLLQKDHSHFENFSRIASPKAMDLAVQKYGFYINILPFHERTPERRMMAVKSRGCAIMYLPHPTEMECMEAIKENPLALHYIKDKKIHFQIEALDSVYGKEYESESQKIETIKEVVALCDKEAIDAFRSILNQNQNKDIYL